MKDYNDWNQMATPPNLAAITTVYRKYSHTQDLVGSGEVQKLAQNPAAYFIEYRDCLKATMLMLNGADTDFTFAARLKGNREIQSTQFFLSPVPNVTYSACLVNKIEQMIMTGVAPYPVERTLIVSGMLESCLTWRIKDHSRLETPHLSVTYYPPKETQYCRS